MASLDLQTSVPPPVFNSAVSSKQQSSRYRDQSPPRRSRHDSESDNSPPRKSKPNSMPDQSPPRRRRNASESDHSPPRKSRSSFKPDHSPPRRRRHDSESDTSPPRKSKPNSMLDQSPPRRRRNVSESDNSPPRKSRSSFKPDHSPPRRRRHDFESGSPPRKPRPNSMPDHSPPRKRRCASESDNSPPRKSESELKTDRPPLRRYRHDSESNSFLPKKSRSELRSSRFLRRHHRGSQSSQSDNSPQRKSRSHFDSSRSSSRRRDERLEEGSLKKRKRDVTSNEGTFGKSRSSTPDLSLRRKQKYYSSLQKSHRVSQQEQGQEQKQKPTSSSRKLVKDLGLGKKFLERLRKFVFKKSSFGTTLDGKKAGLQCVKDIREELSNLKKKEDEVFDTLGDEVTGRNAVAVQRKKMTGKDRENIEDRERKEREAKKQQELEEKYKVWNRGVRQVKQRTENLNEMARVAQEEFARTADNEAMNAHMKEMLFKDDPMLHYIKKKKMKKALKAGEVYPTYQKSYPPNRFNIPPGYRWDSVDRSNHFEEKIVQAANRKAAQEREYYENISKYE
ncbi:unnamed protein product [Enterobius vermicularis]|uniref:BUD13 homolog n=1 Tax=Enterobius vermicularis TaxID=51028 RepID=A0A0N4VIW5_ENTVE|nr:unnamed protein product [Enterobius vermicularis]